MLTFSYSLDFSLNYVHYNAQGTVTNLAPGGSSTAQTISTNPASITLATINITPIGQIVENGVSAGGGGTNIPVGQWTGTYSSPQNNALGKPSTTGPIQITTSTSGTSISINNASNILLYTLQGNLDSGGNFTGTSTQAGNTTTVSTTGTITAINSTQLQFSLAIHFSTATPPNPNDDVVFTGTATSGTTGKATRSNGCFSFGNGSDTNTYYPSSGNSAVDGYVSQVGSNLNQFWQLPIQYNFLDDSASPNAFSDPNSPLIHVGVNLLVGTYTNYGSLATMGVLAHEFGHQLQRTYAPSVLQGVNQNPLITRQAELEADSFSGFYVAYTQNASWTDVQGYYVHTYAFGSADYTDPGWHGSNQNRLDATLLGVRTALYAHSSGYQYTVAQLHDMFYNVTYRSVHSGRSANVFVTPRGADRDMVLQTLEHLKVNTPGVDDSLIQELRHASAQH